MIFVNHFNSKTKKSIENNLDIIYLKTGDVNQQLLLLPLRTKNCSHTQIYVYLHVKDICQFERTKKEVRATTLVHKSPTC